MSAYALRGGPRRGAAHELRRKRSSTFGRARPALVALPCLDELICGAWEGLAADETAACVVCGGVMLADRGAGTGEGRGGCCTSCGSHLA